MDRGFDFEDVTGNALLGRTVKQAVLAIERLVEPRYQPGSET
jgi:hypothetical protein